MLAWLEVLVVAAIAIFFSSFSTPFLSGIFALAMWAIGRRHAGHRGRDARGVAGDRGDLADRARDRARLAPVLAVRPRGRRGQVVSVHGDFVSWGYVGRGGRARHRLDRRRCSPSPACCSSAATSRNVARAWRRTWGGDHRSARLGARRAARGGGDRARGGRQGRQVRRVGADRRGSRDPDGGVRRIALEGLAEMGAERHRGASSCRCSAATTRRSPSAPRRCSRSRAPRPRPRCARRSRDGPVARAPRDGAAAAPARHAAGDRGGARPARRSRVRRAGAAARARGARRGATKSSRTWSRRARRRARATPRRSSTRRGRGGEGRRGREGRRRRDEEEGEERTASTATPTAARRSAARSRGRARGVAQLGALLRLDRLPRAPVDAVAAAQVRRRRRAAADPARRDRRACAASSRRARRKGTEKVIETLIDYADGDDLAVAQSAVDTLRGARIPESLAKAFGGAREVEERRRRRSSRWSACRPAAARRR